MMQQTGSDDALEIPGAAEFGKVIATSKWNRNDRPFGERMSRWCRYVSVLLLLVTAIGLALAGGAAQEPVPCDAALTPIANSLGYTLRQSGVRCEGLYQSPVRALNLELVSLLMGPLAFDAGRDRLLIVSAPASAAASGPIHVRAVALPLRTYYRMDGQLQPDGVLQWPLGEVLRDAGLKARDLGAFGWTGEGTEKVWIPLIVRLEGQDASVTGPVEFKLRSPVPLERLRWRLRKDCAATAPSWQELAADGVRTGETVKLDLPAGLAGIACLEFSAKRPNSDDRLTLKVRILLPG